jgi:hypothetical protein
MTPDLELQEVARRCIWWADVDEALSDTWTFLCHVMVYGLWQDATIMRQRFSNEELCDAAPRITPDACKKVPKP